MTEKTTNKEIIEIVGGLKKNFDNQIKEVVERIIKLEENVKDMGKFIIETGSQGGYHDDGN